MRSHHSEKVKELVAQLCPTLCDPMNCSPPGSSVHVILQEGILAWVAIPFFEDLSDSGIKLGSLALQRVLYYPSHQGSPYCSKKFLDNCNVQTELKTACLSLQN